MIDKIDRTLRTAESWFMIIGITAMGIIMALQVFCRLFFTAITWSEELAKYIFVWVVFIGMSYGIGKRTHIRLDFFVEKLPAKMVKLAEIISDVICILIFAYLFVRSIEYFQFQATQNTATLPGIHMGYVVAAVPVSMVLCIFRSILDIIKVMRKENPA